MSFIGTVGAIAAAFSIGKLVSYLNKKEQEDREKNPEKWTKLDAESWDGQAARYWKKYSRAMERIPRSEWILMDREEKSKVFKRREDLKTQYENLPGEVKMRLRERYKIDTSFPQA
jgi:hypothetical protein